MMGTLVSIIGGIALTAALVWLDKRYGGDEIDPGF